MQSNSKTLSLMQIVEIEKAHRSHRDKVERIRQAQVSLTRNCDPSNTYKRSKLQADIFRLKEKSKVISSQNLRLFNSINHSVKDNSQTKSRLSSASSSRSVHSHSQRKREEEQQITRENCRLYNRISESRSIYSASRKVYGKMPDSNRGRIVNMLVNHFNISPTVIFPLVKTKGNSARKDKYRISNAHNLRKRFA